MGNKKVRVLEINVDDQGNGGVFSLVKNIIESKPENIKIDIAALEPFEKQENITHLNNLGTSVYYVGHNGNKLRKQQVIYNNMVHLLKKKKYDVVHIHADVANKLLVSGLAAKKCGVPKIILHSHATGTDGNNRELKEKIHKVCRQRLADLGAEYAACSYVAAKWMFPRIRKEDVTIIKNGIDLEKYRYNPEVRKETRKQLGLNDEDFLIGHVGRFMYQKNHEYIIDVFDAVCKKWLDEKRKGNVKLLLVGDGELVSDIKKKVKAKGLEDRVILYGLSNKVNELLQAMDAFILPSHFEGLPIVGIEAQAAGLPVLFSSNITREARLIKTSKFISINDDSIEKWVENLLKISVNFTWVDTMEILQGKGYGINETVKELVQLYANKKRKDGKKILIISSGILPVTGAHGGAIEYLTDMYLRYNEKKSDNITVYSVNNRAGFYDKNVYKKTKFRIFDRNRLSYKIKNRILRYTNKDVDNCINANFIRNIVVDLKKRHEENYYDLIIFENGHEFIRYFCKNIKTDSKLVLHLHNDYLNIDLKNSYIKKTLFNEIWVISKYLMSRVSEVDGKSKNIYLLHNAIDTEIVEKNKSTQEEIEHLKEKLKIANKFVFIYVGRVIETKGVYELTQAFIKLNKKYNDISLLIVGGDWNQEENEEYYRKISDISKRYNNIVMTGHVNNMETIKYYECADAQVIPSKCQEAFGLICLEGMCFNLPLIVSDVGAIKEVCGESAHYVNKDNMVDELYYAMSMVYTDRESAMKKTTKYVEILNKYSKEDYLKTFYELIHKP